MGAVDDQNVHPGLDQGAGAIQEFGVRADRGAHQQPPFAVLGRPRVLAALDDVLQGYESDQATVVVDEGKLFDLVALEPFLGLVERRSRGRGDELFPRGHDLGDRFGKVALKAEVAIGHQAEQLAVEVHHRQTPDLVLGKEPLGVFQAGVGGQGDGVGYHARFASLDAMDHFRLDVDGEVFVDDPEPALPGHGNGHLGLGDGVHGCGEDGDVKGQAAGEAGLGLGRFG